MDFSAALAAVKAGKRIARPSAPDSYVVYQPGYPSGIPINANTSKATGIPEGTVCAFGPYLMQLRAEGDFVPWVASQGDLLASDWMTV